MVNDSESTMPEDNQSTSRRAFLYGGASVGAVSVGASLMGVMPTMAEPGSDTASERFDRGATRMREIAGDDALAVVDALNDIAPDLGRYVVEFAYGDVYSRQGLSAPQRQLITLGALTAIGDTAAQLQFHIDAALHVGLQPAQVIEAFTHTIPFIGFPRALNAVSVARRTFRDRSAEVRPVVVNDARDRYERGVAQLRAVDGEHGLDVVESLNDVAPDLGRYVVEFSFGDVYSRPGLDLPQRQLVTLGALVASGDTAPQQKVHVNAALNVGLDAKQVVETVIHLVPYTGFPRALNIIRVVREVFKERGITP